MHAAPSAVSPFLVRPQSGGGHLHATNLMESPFHAHVGATPHSFVPPVSVWHTGGAFTMPHAAAAAAAAHAAAGPFQFAAANRPTELKEGDMPQTTHMPFVQLPPFTAPMPTAPTQPTPTTAAMMHTQMRAHPHAYEQATVNPMLPLHPAHVHSPPPSHLVVGAPAAAAVAAVQGATLPGLAIGHAAHLQPGAMLPTSHSPAPQMIQLSSTVLSASSAASAPALDPRAARDRIGVLLHEGELLRSRHQYADAIQRYNSILFLDPRHVQALNFKGTCHKALKEIGVALECYSSAAAIAPTDWVSLNNIGILYKESDLLDAAIEHYARAIQHGPAGCVAHENMSVVKTDLGTRLKLAGATDAAVEAYREAIEHHKGYWPAYFNLGVVYSERGDFESALKFYNLAVEKNPTYVEALCNIGVIFKNSGQLTLAIEYYQRALKANPNFTIAANNLAIALTDRGTQVKNEGHLEEGVSYYKRALHWNSKYPAAWYNLGVAYAERMRPDDAKLSYEMATLFDPKCAEAYNNLGVIYKDRGNLEQAVHHYGQALQANPSFSQTLNNLSVIYTMLGKLDEAFDFCSRAIASNPLYAEAHNNLGVLYRDEGRIDDAIRSYEDCLKIDPTSRNAGQNRLLALNSVCRAHQTAEETMEAVWQAHREWGDMFAAQHQQERYTTWANAKHLSRAMTEAQRLSSARPLRIGYISADFFTHSVSYFIESPLRFANPSRTHITCYANVARRDKKTALLQSYAHAWRAVHDKSTKEVCEMIREDGIDILVELTGHTAGNRLDVLALKPAPVQVTWIGYPNTTGLPTIDYRFSDAIVDPPDTPQKYSETIVRLPGPFLCYSPPTDAPPVAQTPALHRGYITFGSFNNLAKINEEVLNGWCHILHKVTNSRILIKCKPFASSSVSAKMLQRFADRGIESTRVDLVPLLPTTSEHLATYAGVDISVDTFPYAGTTTTCESLYMGVPVVTLKREKPNNHAHNVGASLISRIQVPGAESLIATDMQQYISSAVSLALDLPRLQQLRQQLRPAMLQSTLCDGPTFGRQLETVYESLWTRYSNDSDEAASAAVSTAAQE